MGLAESMRQYRAEVDVQSGERLFHYAKNNRGITEREPMQPGGMFRTSGLYNLCAREEVLAYKFDIIRTWHKDAGLQITLDIGHLFHDLYRDVYFGPMGEWIGAWRCIHCGWDTDIAGLSQPPVSDGGCQFGGLMAKMPDKCGSCHAPFHVHPDTGEQGAGTFKEWKIEDRKIGLSGHVDGWCLSPFKKRVLTDLKSHGHRGFGSRKSLRMGHGEQVLGYNYMTGDKGGEVWYLNKSPWGDHPAFIRSVKVPYDEAILKSKVLVPLRSIQEGLHGGAIPERLCVNSEVPRAEQCQLCDICFNV